MPHSKPADSLHHSNVTCCLFKFSLGQKHHSECRERERERERDRDREAGREVEREREREKTLRERPLVSSCEDLFVAWRREDDHVPKQRGLPKQHCESVTQWRLGKDAIASTLTFIMQVIGLSDSDALEVAGGMHCLSQ